MARTLGYDIVEASPGRVVVAARPTDALLNPAGTVHGSFTADSGPVRAEGSVLTLGRRIGTAEGRLTDAKGRLLVHATTTCLVFERS